MNMKFQVLEGATIPFEAQIDYSAHLLDSGQVSFLLAAQGRASGTEINGVKVRSTISGVITGRFVVATAVHIEPLEAAGICARYEN